MISRFRVFLANSAGVILWPSILSGCSMQDPTPKHPDKYRFLLAPAGLPTTDATERKMFVIPAEYIETQRREDPIVTGQFTFPVSYPTGVPIHVDQLADKQSLLISVILERPGAVRRRIDGSWQNHFSGFSRSIGEKYGLNLFQRPESYQLSQLFKSDDNRTLIECPHIKGHEPSSCKLMSQAFEDVTVQIVFSPSLLPEWRNMLSLSLSIVGHPVPYRGK